MNKPLTRSRAQTPVDADDLTPSLIAFLAADIARLDRFVALTGVAIADLRKLSEESGFAENLLAYVADDERLLLAYAAETGRDPASIFALRQSLAPPPFES